ncbi:hypothetical protein E2P81_ATG08969 [Venturia nashicola]|nr:hypothetical protein E2P81_ATG08969 [Venturia nashicola]
MTAVLAAALESPKSVAGGYAEAPALSSPLSALPRTGALRIPEASHDFVQDAMQEKRDDKPDVCASHDRNKAVVPREEETGDVSGDRPMPVSIANDTNTKTETLQDKKISALSIITSYSGTTFHSASLAAALLSEQPALSMEQHLPR